MQLGRGGVRGKVTVLASTEWGFRLAELDELIASERSNRPGKGRLRVCWGARHLHGMSTFPWPWVVGLSVCLLATP
jgi:hypothetical protein